MFGRSYLEWRGWGCFIIVVWWLFGVCVVWGIRLGLGVLVGYVRGAWLASVCVGCILGVLWDYGFCLRLLGYDCIRDLLCLVVVQGCLVV